MPTTVINNTLDLSNQSRYKKKYSFFNKNGDYINTLKSENDRYNASIFFEPNSSDLFKTLNLHVLEELDGFNYQQYTDDVDDLELDKFQLFNEHGISFLSGNNQESVVNNIVDNKIFINDPFRFKRYDIISDDLDNVYQVTDINFDNISVIGESTVLPNFTTIKLVNGIMVHDYLTDQLRPNLSDWSEPFFYNKVYVDRPLTIVNSTSNSGVKYVEKNLKDIISKRYLVTNNFDFSHGNYVLTFKSSFFNPIIYNGLIVINNDLVILGNPISSVAINNADIEINNVRYKIINHSEFSAFDTTTQYNLNTSIYSFRGKLYKCIMAYVNNDVNNRIDIFNTDFWIESDRFYIDTNVTINITGSISLISDISFEVSNNGTLTNEIVKINFDSTLLSDYFIFNVVDDNNFELVPTILFDDIFDDIEISSMISTILASANINRLISIKEPIVSEKVTKVVRNKKTKLEIIKRDLGYKLEINDIEYLFNSLDFFFDNYVAELYKSGIYCYKEGDQLVFETLYPNIPLGISSSYNQLIFDAVEILFDINRIDFNIPFFTITIDNLIYTTTTDGISTAKELIDRFISDNTSPNMTFTRVGYDKLVIKSNRLINLNIETVLLINRVTILDNDDLIISSNAIINRNKDVSFIDQGFSKRQIINISNSEFIFNNNDYVSLQVKSDIIILSYQGAFFGSFNTGGSESGFLSVAFNSTYAVGDSIEFFVDILRTGVIEEVGISVIKVRDTINNVLYFIDKVSGFGSTSIFNSTKTYSLAYNIDNIKKHGDRVIMSSSSIFILNKDGSIKLISDIIDDSNIIEYVIDEDVLYYITFSNRIVAISLNSLETIVSVVIPDDVVSLVARDRKVFISTTTDNIYLVDDFGAPSFSNHFNTANPGSLIIKDGYLYIFFNDVIGIIRRVDIESNQADPSPISVDDLNIFQNTVTSSRNGIYFTGMVNRLLFLNTDTLDIVDSGVSFNSYNILYEKYGDYVLVHEQGDDTLFFFRNGILINQVDIVDFDTQNIVLDDFSNLLFIANNNDTYLNISNILDVNTIISSQFISDVNNYLSLTNDNNGTLYAVNSFDSFELLVIKSNKYNAFVTSMIYNNSLENYINNIPGYFNEFLLLSVNRQYRYPLFNDVDGQVDIVAELVGSSNIFITNNSQVYLDKLSRKVYAQDEPISIALTHNNPQDESVNESTLNIYVDVQATRVFTNNVTIQSLGNGLFEFTFDEQINIDGFYIERGISLKLVATYNNQIVLTPMVDNTSFKVVSFTSNTMIIESEFDIEADLNNFDIDCIDLIFNPIEIAKFELSAETEIEDIRYKTELDNTGKNINIDDISIFRFYDVNEQGIDYSYLNSKRKELLSLREEIFNFIGSYKGITSAIDFFGYNDIEVNAYYQNNDVDSDEYLRLLKIDIQNINNINSFINKNNRYIDTNLFNLNYSATDIYGNYVSDILNISQLFNKLMKLKTWLENNVIPITHKILDISAKIDFAENKNIYHNNSVNNTFSIKDTSGSIEPFISEFFTLPINSGSQNATTVNIGFNIHGDIDINTPLNIKIRTYSSYADWEFNTVYNIGDTVQYVDGKIYEAQRDGVIKTTPLSFVNIAPEYNPLLSSYEQGMITRYKNKYYRFGFITDNSPYLPFDTNNAPCISGTPDITLGIVDNFYNDLIRILNDTSISYFDTLLLSEAQVRQAIDIFDIIRQFDDWCNLDQAAIGTEYFNTSISSLLEPSLRPSSLLGCIGEIKTFVGYFETVRDRYEFKYIDQTPEFIINLDNPDFICWSDITIWSEVNIAPVKSIDKYRYDNYDMLLPVVINEDIDPIISIETTVHNGYGGGYSYKKIYDSRFNTFI